MVSLFVLAMVVACAYFGYRKGASRIAGALAAMVVALFLAPAFGRAAEGLVSTITGSGGILNRLVSIAMAAALIMAAAGYLFSIAARKLTAIWLPDAAKYRRADKLVGLGLGGFEGLLLVFAIMWAVLALEPVAASRIASDEAAGNQPQAVAARLRKAADAIHASAFGAAAHATMPSVGTDLMALASDFAAVSRSREALDHFTSTPVMRRINNLPSVNEARKAIDADPALRGTFSKKGIDAQGIRRILESDTLLAVLDNTSIASDFKPLVSDLKAAIAEAKSRIKPAPGPPENPPETPETR